MFIKLNIIITILLSKSILFYGQEKAYTLNCYYPNLPNGSKAYLLTEKYDTVNKSISKEGTFTFVGTLNDQGRFHFITFDSSVSHQYSTAIFLTHRIINVTGDIKSREIDIQGSPEQEQYNFLQNEFAKYSKSLSESDGKLNEYVIAEKRAEKIGDTMTAKKHAVQVSMQKSNSEEIINKFYSSLYNWVSNNKDSYIAPYLVLNGMSANRYKLDSNLALWRSLPQNIQESYYGKKLNNELHAQLKSKKISHGNKIPNFTVTDQSGGDVDIYSILSRNQVTLIDCWASWCSPCRKAIPRLTELYNKFNNKGFSIIGISIDKKSSDWHKAIKEDNTPWPHYQESAQNASLSSLFGLQTIPAYILVKKDGTLLAFSAGMSLVPTFGTDLTTDFSSYLEKIIGLN